LLTIKQFATINPTDNLAVLGNIPEVDRVGVKIRIFMGGIKLNIVNQNNRLKHGWIEVKSLSFILTQSS
jgi:hypothetical protein